MRGSIELLYIYAVVQSLYTCTALSSLLLEHTLHGPDKLLYGRTVHQFLNTATLNNAHNGQTKKLLEPPRG